MHSKVGQETHRTSDFVFRGSHVLKGVCRAREYPIFAIDRECGDAVNQAVARMNGNTLKAHQIVDVCHACGSDPNWPFAMYLPDSSKDMFTNEPQDAMAPSFESESTLEGAESVAALDNTAEPVVPEKQPLG